MPRLAWLCVLTILGCGSAPPPAAPSPVESPPPEATPPPRADAPPPSSAPSRADDSRISRSAGVEGGIVLLWPRIAGSGDVVPAAETQAALRAVVERIAARRPLDVRPEPERTCPQAGCRGWTVSPILLHSGAGCAVVVAVSAPGRSPSRLIHWAGRVQIRRDEVAFREPPEGALQVDDFTGCADLATELEASAPEIES